MSDLPLIQSSDLVEILVAKVNSTITAVNDLPDTVMSKANVAAYTFPTINDDTSRGYSRGSRWLDLSSNDEYVCLNASVGSAIWKPTTSGGSGSVGDMMKSIYDNNNNGVVDKAEMLVGSGGAERQRKQYRTTITPQQESTKIVELPSPYQYEVGKNTLDVYVNGILQDCGYEYTETTANRITFASGVIKSGHILTLKFYQ